ncbi:MAG TPA: DNA repair protein RadA [Geminicoccaceae bacterium]|nr:DNA repair protein RadA [Geminicoccaceae bacterium]
MARAETHYVCQSCGAVHAKWAGRCDACGEWNTLAEEQATPTVPKGLRAGAGKPLELVGLAGASVGPSRLATAIDELDRVLGGGLVPGSTVLIGGDPGIGKSTLVLQAAAALAMAGAEVAYVSGEESIDQIRLRAARLGIAAAPVQMTAATSVRDILATFDGGRAPQLVVIDSIQTMYVDNVEAAPGTVTQLRTSAHELIRFAKRRGTALLLIGHVTKDGQIAGPRVLEHMVDAVVYFEGERGHQFRILRAVKNRFGAANEIGVFEMAERGLVEVPDPSALFLAEREAGISGAAVFAGIEGSRPLLIEIQALVGPSALGTPRRTVVGWDGARLAMLLAVLETRCGLVIGGRDVYLNVAGGLRIAEPAADLAVAAALVSALFDRPAPAAAVFFGEVGLAGEVRAVSQTEARMKEAAKLGFEQVVLPAAGGRCAPTAGDGLRIEEIRRLSELRDLLGGNDGTANAVGAA